MRITDWRCCCWQWCCYQYPSKPHLKNPSRLYQNKSVEVIHFIQMLAYFYLITAASIKRMIHHCRTTAMTKQQCQHHEKLTTMSIKVSLLCFFSTVLMHSCLMLRRNHKEENTWASSKTRRQSMHAMIVENPNRIKNSKRQQQQQQQQPKQPQQQLQQNRSPIMTNACITQH